MNIKALALTAFSSFLVLPQVAIAQQTTTGIVSGSVLSTELGETSCRITLSRDSGPPSAEVVEKSLCEQAIVGQTIQLSYTVTGLDVIPPPDVATVTSLVAGDRACYVDLTDAEGNTTGQLASFEICAQDILDTEVALTYGTGNILAYSCSGDMDCGRSERALLITQAEPTGSPTTQPPTTQPPTTQPQPLISSLPDGNYRYWTGTPSSGIVSDAELLANRGITFTFSKKGRDVVGTFGYVDGEAICVQGQVNENTVTGISVERNAGALPISTNETFASFGPSGLLNVRRGRQIPSNSAIFVGGRRVPIDVVRYDSTLLNLNGLNRINAGTRVPPSGCR